MPSPTASLSELAASLSTRTVSNFARLELVGRVAEIADDELLSAAYGITRVMEFVEGEEQIAEFLTHALEATQHPGVRRLICMKLAEVYTEMDQPEAARNQLRALIVID